MKSTDLLKAINPKLNPSYSPNMHKWLKTWIKTYPEWMIPEVWIENGGLQLWRIGYHDNEGMQNKNCGFVGIRLNAVLCQGASANKERGWFMGLGTGNMTPVEDFWERYLEIGRCAIDTDHKQWFIGDEDRYSMDGEIRTCNWCGAKHKRRLETKTTVKEIEHFDAIEEKKQ